MGAAYKAAGVASPHRPSTWTDREVLASLRKHAEAASKLSPTLAAECRRRFGTVDAARLAAGLPGEETRRRQATKQAAATRAATYDRRYPWRRWSADDVLQKLRALNGRAVPRQLALACAARFGSIGTAAARAGGSAPPQCWSHEKIRLALRQANRDDLPLGKSLTKACANYFGSITAAKLAAGVTPGRTWTNDAIVKELRARIRRGLTGAGRLLHSPCATQFGSVDAALRAAGVG